MKLLQLDSSILGAKSVSRTLSAAIVQRFQARGAEVSYRDLADEPLPHLSAGHLAGLSAHESPPSTAAEHELALGKAVLEEFLAADIVVIGVGFYNFGIPSQLKAWIDRILVAGKTFRYTKDGPEGLVGPKRLILAIARGGFYGPGTPGESLEHAESYLRAVFSLIGIHELEVVSANGVSIGPQQREESVRAALERVAGLPVAAWAK
jgi:FMN-dependent NADH-azoreductase